MNYLLILNDPPYGTERCYNAFRLGLSLRKQPGVALKIFLLERRNSIDCSLLRFVI